MKQNPPISSRWTKGQSGNRAGRGCASEKFRVLLEEKGLGEWMAGFLERVVLGKENGMDDPKSRQWAATEILNRLYGKAPQHIVVDAQGSEVTFESKIVEALRLSPHERRKRIEELEKKDPSS